MQSDGFSFHLPLAFLYEEIDTYINLAKIKSHMETGVSLSLKNQMGLASQEDRIKMHQTDLEGTIAQLAYHLRPDLSILEGHPAMEGNGPHNGRSRNLKMIAASEDMVEMDSFTCHLLGFDPMGIEHIRQAHDLGAGRLFNRERLDDYKKYFVEDFRPADKVHKFGFRIFAYPTYSCSRCISAVLKAGETFKDHPLKYRRFFAKAFLSLKRINVVFGRPDHLELDGKGKIICIGSCSKQLAEAHGVDCLDKCPPGSVETVNYLLDQIVK